MATPLDLWDLLHAGDWASAHGDAAALQRVANLLAKRLGADLATPAQTIARLAMIDLTFASLLWGNLAAHLRGEAERELPRH